MNDVTREVDACGLNCPMPILRAKVNLRDLASGDVLRVFATDPGSVKDFEDFARHSGNELMDTATEGPVFIFLLRKA